MRIARWFLIPCIMALLVFSAGAWDEHEKITYFALKNLHDLDAFDSLEITPYTYGEIDTSVYNPNFVLRFDEGEVGDRVSAFEVLVAYSQEPDWDLDKQLQLHPRQNLTGGSQGWRHQRYTLFGGLITLGVAPERTQHFYNMALHAYGQGDLYWAFRFLSRSIHYIQDMTQPLHALPLPISDLIFKHRLSVAQATHVSENVHYHLEGYYGRYLLADDERVVQALTQREVSIKNPQQGAIDANKRARRISIPQYRLALEIWPELRGDVSVPLPVETDPNLTNAKAVELWEILEETLADAGAYSRALVRMFLEDIQRL